VRLAETFQNGVALDCRSPRLEQERHVGETIIDGDLSHVR
jgi:hypothetical protein